MKRLKTSCNLTNQIRALSQAGALALLLAALAGPLQAGVALKLYYDPISGNAVSDLTSAPIFPNAPTFNEVLTSGLREGINWGESFGAWTRGFIEAPQTGQYTFWIASDDDSQFWLSSSHDPAGKVKIAENVGAVAQNSYNGKPAQQSAPQTLVRGQKYYFEILHKEGTGDDHCSVAWTLPDGTFATPIPADYVWPYPVDMTYQPVAAAPSILSDYFGAPVTTLPASISVEEGSPVEMTVTVEASQPAFVQWFSNGVPIPDASLLSYRIPAAALSQDGSTYSVTITNSLNQASAATTLSVSQDTTAPFLVDALNLGNPGGIIAVIFSEAVDTATATAHGNYALDNGATVTVARIGSRPGTVLLTASGLVAGTAYTLTVNNVRDRAATPNTIAPGSTLPVEQSLQTWLRLDETSGTTAGDASGNSLAGTLFNGASAGYLGKVLRAVKLDGVDDHVRLGPGYADYSSGLTMAFWANPSTIGIWARFLELGNAPASDNILFARAVTSDTLAFEVYVGGASGGQVTADGAIVLNQWQHYVAAMEASGLTILYRNGMPVATNTTGVPNNVTRTNNFLGRSNWGGDGYYGGKLDDVRIYNRVLSAAAVQALAAGAGPDDTDPAIPAVTVTATVPTTALHDAPPGRFTVTRTGSTAAALGFSYTLGGTATNGVNYTNLPLSGVISAGSSTAEIFVQPINFSFTDAQRSVILSLTPSLAYIIGELDQATVTIANNNVSPTPELAIARNAGGAVTRNTVQVWFASPVTLPSATNLANYSFNPALPVTGATLISHSLGVELEVSTAVPANALLTVTGVQDPGGNSISNQIPVRPLLGNTANLVANSYHSPNSRAGCLSLVTDGLVDNTSEPGGMDTWGTDGTDYVGLLYTSSVEIYAAKVDLGRQFGDGGSWGSKPKLYRLKNPVDTDGFGAPEQVTNLWEEVAAPIVSGSLFDPAGDANPSPNTPIVFNLSGLAPAQRTGYGWAVGGVAGDGSATFLSISEMSAYGIQGATPAFQLVATPAGFNVAAGQRAKLKVWTTLPVTFQWQKDGFDLFGETKSYYGLPPVSPTDNASVFTAVLSQGGSPVTNLSATLTVTPRATPAVVRAATFDPNNTVTAGMTNPVIYVWFDESVEPGSAQNAGNYALNDPGLSLMNAVLDTQGFRVVLTYSGAPTVNNLSLTVSSVQDLSGNVMASQVVPVAALNAPASRVVANAYQQGRAAALVRSTDGIVINDANQQYCWTTFGSPLFSTDFVGLGYAEPRVFDAVVMDLGWQFGDGGDWSEPPRLFIQKTQVDTNQNPPENDASNWMEVPAVLMSGNIFDGQIAVPANITPLPNATVAFDLSDLPAAQRTGFGWAIGGVPGNAIPGWARFVTVAELRGFAASAQSLTNISGPPEFALNVQPAVSTRLAGGRLTLYTIVTGTQPLSYQWRHNGVNLTDSERIIGAHSNILTIAEVLSSDAGSYQLMVTNSAGWNASDVATVSVTTGIPSFNGGTNWTTSGGASISGNLLQLTTDYGQAMSAFLNDPLYIGAFRASFTYQDVGGGGADGTVFALHNAPAGPAALGWAGGELGYRPDVSPSVGLILNIYGGAPGGAGFSIGINGELNTPYQSTAPVNLAGGNPIAVALNYDGTTVSMTLKDTVTTGTFSASAPLDIPGTVGANTAYVGFTAGSGGLLANQRVTDFVFTSLPDLTITRAGNTVVFTWPNAVGNFLLQESPSLGTPSWSNVPATVDLVGGRNQAVVPEQAGDRFFRLLLQ